MRFVAVVAVFVAMTASPGFSQGVDPLTPPVVTEKNLGNWQPGELVEQQLTTPLSSPPVIWSDLGFVRTRAVNRSPLPVLV